MIPKDPVYSLTAAVERVKETIPDQDAEGWLRDAIAADHITWAYVWIEKDKGHSWPTPIDILPMAAIMEVPNLEIDWLKGTAAVRQSYRGVVEYPVVVSRRDLDHELANFTASQETSEALATSNALHLRSQSETAKLRKRLTKWIEEFAVTDEAKGLVKADFFELALKGVDPRIPYYMFREAWSAAEIPEDFTKPGVRLKRTPE